MKLEICATAIWAPKQQYLGLYYILMWHNSTTEWQVKNTTKRQWLLSSFTENYCQIMCGPGSSVGIATDYGLDGPGSNSGGDEIFRSSRLALGPTRLPEKRVPSLSRVKVRPRRAADHSPLLVPRSWKSRDMPLPTLWATTGLYFCHFTFYCQIL